MPVLLAGVAEIVGAAVAENAIISIIANVKIVFLIVLFLLSCC
jgi:hypothetical protein